MLKQLRVSGGLWDVLLTALLMAVLGYAVFFLSAPIAQTDRAGREYRNIYLLALGILGFAQAILFHRRETKKAESRALVWLALLRNIYPVALAILGFAPAIPFQRRAATTADSRALVWLALLLPSYAAFPLLPLPLYMLRVMSPARAELLAALAPLSLRPEWAPLSVAPALTLEHFLLFAGYAVVFFAVRDVARSSRDAPWLPVLPVLAIAVG